jgi:hypothetical protein
VVVAGSAKEDGADGTEVSTAGASGESTCCFISVDATDFGGSGVLGVDAAAPAGKGLIGEAIRAGRGSAGLRSALRASNRSAAALVRVYPAAYTASTAAELIATRLFAIFLLLSGPFCGIFTNCVLAWSDWTGCWE